MAALIKTCPSGHTLTFDHFKSYVDLTKTDIMEAVTFTCDGGKRGHQFSLAKAVKSGMFTAEEAEKIKSMGIQHKKQYAGPLYPGVKVSK